MSASLCYDCEFNDRKTPCRQPSGAYDYDAMADAYIRYWNARLREQTDEGAEWIADCLFEIEREEPRAALAFIVVALDRIETAEQLAVHAAGPMETVLAHCGPQIIDAVEALAARSPKFRLLLSGIWGRNRIDADVWSRVAAAVARGPAFCDDPRTVSHASASRRASDATIARLLQTSAVDDLGGRAAVLALTGGL